VTGQALVKDGSGKLVLESDKGDKEEGFDVVLMATGRVPNIGSLGLDKAGVKVSPQGYIDVDGEARGDTRLGKEGAQRVPSP
jgi:pyruvate/2-oxoglutarate dehydrogenase complex dihydrolipoamide dehydrogenase (E3) component